jgi:hypothetical protein
MPPVPTNVPATDYSLVFDIAISRAHQMHRLLTALCVAKLAFAMTILKNPCNVPLAYICRPTAQLPNSPTDQQPSIYITSLETC